MPSVTVENYLKQLYLEQQREPSELVSMGKLAIAMNVVPGTATSMIKALAESGLVEIEPRGGTRLTRGGEQLALPVLRRHRLVELFLVKSLGLDWSEVHEEAEELEHAISDKVLEKIDAALGHPSVDPHGDPIPSAKGRGKESPMMSLADCPVDSAAHRGPWSIRIPLSSSSSIMWPDAGNKHPPIETPRRHRRSGCGQTRKAGSPSTLGTVAAGKILVEAL